MSNAPGHLRCPPIRGAEEDVLRRIAVTLPIVFAAALAPAAMAQTTSPPPAKHNNNTYGSPLDTIMSTHLWTDVAPAKGFVQEGRPDPKTLDYTPLTGDDPQRPKPRDKANISALQAELERDLATNSRKGDAPKPAKKARRSVAKGSEKRAD